MSFNSLINFLLDVVDQQYMHCIRFNDNLNGMCVHKIAKMYAMCE